MATGSQKKQPRRRSTRQRRAILNVLRQTKSHPTADWVYEQVKQEIPNISLGTVYRNLKLLRDLGEIMEISFGSAQSHFDGNPNPHYHFHCLDCNRILDVDIPVRHELEQEVRDHHGWEVHRHRVEFYGRCDKCSRQREE
ncbi:MAG: transcriptional repressor [Firmicutes bacterium]|nr:transcriptional repressor [Bacillota bacterium]